MSHNILWDPLGTLHLIYVDMVAFHAFMTGPFFTQASNLIMYKHAQGIIRYTTGLDTCGGTCFCGTSPDWRWCPADFIHSPFDFPEEHVFLHRPLLGPTIPWNPGKESQGNCFPHSVISDFVWRLSSMSGDSGRSPWGFTCICTRLVGWKEFTWFYMDPGYPGLCCGCSGICMRSRTSNFRCPFIKGS